MKTKVIKISTITILILSIIITFVFMFLGGYLFGKTMEFCDNLGMKLIILGVLILCIYVQIIAHEGGYFIFGK